MAINSLSHNLPYEYKSDKIESITIQSHYFSFKLIDGELGQARTRITKTLFC